MIKRFSNHFGRLRRDGQGSAALEFALTAPMFLAAVFSAFEVALLITRIAMLDYATGQVSKSVYIGAVSAGEVTQDDLQIEVCDLMSIVVDDCIENLTIEMVTINGFGDIPNDDAECRNSAVDIEPIVEFDPGGTSSVVFVRSCITTELITPGLGVGLNLPQHSSGKIELVSSMAFMNEPF